MNIKNKIETILMRPTLVTVLMAFGITFAIGTALGLMSNMDANAMMCANCKNILKGFNEMGANPY